MAHSTPRRMRLSTEKLSKKLEDEIPEVICTPVEDKYQITVTLLKRNGISFDLLPHRLQEHLSHGYLEVQEYEELVKALRELL